MTISDDLRALVIGPPGGWAADLSPNQRLTILAAAEYIEELEDDIERTRRAWVDGDDPLCEDVCMVACKGPCGGAA